LILLIATKSEVPGTKAILVALFSKGPSIPGPLKKKPNTSLNLDPT